MATWVLLLMNITILMLNVTSQDITCPSSEGLSYTTNPDCLIYYQCKNQIQLTGTCAPWQRFDIHTLTCKQLNEVDCNPEYAGVWRTVYENPGDFPGEIPGEIEEAPVSEGLSEGTDGQGGISEIGGSQGIGGIPGIEEAQVIGGSPGFGSTQGIGGIPGIGGPQGLGGIPGTGAVQGTGWIPGFGGAQGIGGIPGIGRPQGLGGIPGIGGAQGIGGIPGYGGAQGIGGLPGIGGAQGIGGLPGYGGAQGIGGLPGIGGAQGIGGLPGYGGAQGIGEIPGIGGAQGIGGLPGIGGAQGIGGLPGIGGAQGIGGLPGYGGAQGIGGLPGIGGAQGIGGLPGIGGAQGIGGLPGIGGAQGIGGLPGYGGVEDIGGIPGYEGMPDTSGIPGIGGITGTGSTQGIGGMTLADDLPELGGQLESGGVVPGIGGMSRGSTIPGNVFMVEDIQTMREDQASDSKLTTKNKSTDKEEITPSVRTEGKVTVLGEDSAVPPENGVMGMIMEKGRIKSKLKTVVDIKDDEINLKNRTGVEGLEQDKNELLFGQYAVVEQKRIKFEKVMERILFVLKLRNNGKYGMESNNEAAIISETDNIKFKDKLIGRKRQNSVDRLNKQIWNKLALLETHNHNKRSLIDENSDETENLPELQQQDSSEGYWYWCGSGRYVFVKDDTDGNNVCLQLQDPEYIDREGIGNPVDGHTYVGSNMIH